jgi:hypothetical protein
MNTSSRSRNGLHNLNRNVGRRCVRHATTMLEGVRRPRQPNALHAACQLLQHYLLIRQRRARLDPHLFGPRAHDYFLDTLRLEQREKETAAALEKVYGQPPPGEPKRFSTLWTGRYFPQPEERRRFLKWFHQQYPSP